MSCRTRAFALFVIAYTLLKDAGPIEWQSPRFRSCGDHSECWISYRSRLLCDSFGHSRP